MTKFFFLLPSFFLPSLFLIAQAPYNLKPASERPCTDVPLFREMAKALPNDLRIVEDSIFLYTHDRDIFREAFSTSKDGIAIDFIRRGQLPCEGEFLFNSSPIYDGRMLQPVLLPELFERNQLKDGFKLFSFVGKIPPDMLSEQIDINVIAIKDGHACENSYPLEIPFGRLPLFQINPIWAFAEIQETVDLKRLNLSPKQLERKVTYTPDQAAFEVSFQKNKYFIAPEDMDNITGFAEAYIESLDSIVIRAYSSVEGSKANNLRLQQARADRIKGALLRNGVPEGRIRTETAEHWGRFREQVIGTEWAEMASLSEKEVKNKIRGPMEEELEPLLAQQRVAEISIYYHIPDVMGFDEPYYKARTTPEAQKKIRQFEKFIELDQPEDVLKIQSALIDDFLGFELNIDDLLELDVPMEKRYLPHLSNLLAVELFFNASVRIDSNFVNRLLAIQQLDPDYYPMRFNMAGFATRFMYQTERALIPPQNLLEVIYDLDQTGSYKIEYQDLEATLGRLLANFHLGVVDYFFENRQYEARRNSMRELRNYFMEGNNMSEGEAIEVALYFNRNYFMDWTPDVLLPYYKNGDCSEDLLFTLTQTSVHLDQVVQRTINKLLAQCRERNPRRFCAWVARNFQLLREPGIKTLYCNTCE
jgi:hypothetical protein